MRKASIAERRNYIVSDSESSLKLNRILIPVSCRLRKYF